MMAENPKYWWSLNGSSSSSYSLPLNYTSDDHNHHNKDLPLPWSQLLLGGLASEEGRRFDYNTSSSSSAAPTPYPNRNPNSNPKPNTEEYGLKKLEKKWADNDNDQITWVASDRVKQEMNIIEQSDKDDDKVEVPCWMMPILASSMLDDANRRRSSSDTSLSSSSTNNTCLDFSTDQLHNQRIRNQHPIPDHHSSISHLQCSDTSATSGASKKARVQRSSTQHPPLKVRKEKLGDRITALHQLVSPFGKTDTASVLLEAIGYIRFLEAQIQALSSPYFGNVSSGSTRIQQSATDSAPKDLRSRGLRLVPVDCAHHINTTNIMGETI